MEITEKKNDISEDIHKIVNWELNCIVEQLQVLLGLTATKSDFCSNMSGIFFPDVVKVSGSAQCQ